MSSMGPRAVLASALLGAVLVATACASNDENADGSSGSSSSGNSSSGGSSGLVGQTDGGGISDDVLNGCATDSAKANPLPLDLYILFDSSGSMLYEAAPGVTKMKATTDAMMAFVNDPSSAGISVALTFFPAHPPGAPYTCTDSSQCTAAGICTVKKCNTPGIVKFCDSPTDCGGDPCINAGVCASDPTGYCNLANSECSAQQGTTCVSQGTFTCAPRDACLEGNYTTPVVPFGALPGNAVAIGTALTGKKPFGGTPTSAALAEVEKKAYEYALSNAGHTVAIVLVTDGLPSQCNPNIDAVAALAGVGAGANPKVKTFVIGVFSTSEQMTAQSNLDKIATSGETGKAFVVGVGANTTKDFIAAMSAVRGKALPCEYKVPQPDGGIPDYGKVNVRHTSPSGTKTVYPNAKNAAGCAGGGGWYFDVDPAGGAAPGKIILCPDTCTAANSAGGQVDVVLGCQTVVR